MDISENLITSKGGIRLAQVLEKSKTLKQIYLANNKFGNDAFTKIGNAMRVNQSIEILDISKNTLGKIDMVFNY